MNRELANPFEHFCVAQCSQIYNLPFYHWSMVAHEDLFKSGYINDYNKHRKYKQNASLEGNTIRDVGVDFIGVAKDHYIMGQSKLYASRVGLKDIGTWLAKCAVCMQCSTHNTGVLCTVNGCTHEVLEDCQSMKVSHIKMEYIKFQTWYNKSKIEHNSSLVNEYELPLRDYQKQVIQESCDHILQTTIAKVVLNLTCALGKTVIIGHILSKLQPKCIIAAAPIRTDVENLYDRLPFFLPNHKVFLFNSDNTSYIEDLIDEYKECVKNKKSLLILTTFVTLSDKIAAFITKKCGGKPKKEEKEMQQYFQDAFFVIDEAHDIPKSNKSLLHVLNASSKALYCTATLPVDFHVICNYTLCIDKYDFPFALQNKYVVDYRIFVPMRLICHESLDEVYKIVSSHKIVSMEITEKASFLMKGMLQAGLRRCIVYLTTKEECKEFIKVWLILGKEYYGEKVYAFRVNEDISKQQRQQIFTQFSTNEDNILQVIASCSCLDQAVNIVRCDSTFITKVTRDTSAIRIFQRFMRAARLDSENPNKVNTCFLWCDDEFTLLEDVICKLKMCLKDPVFEKKVRVINQTYDTQDHQDIKEILNIQDKKLNTHLLQWIDSETRKKYVFEAMIEVVKNTGKVPHSKSALTLPNGYIVNTGSVWGEMKKNKNLELRDKLCNASDVYKKDLERYKSSKENKLTIEQKRDAMIEFAKKSLPKFSDIFTIPKTNKVVLVGREWDSMKQGKNKELMEYLCVNNQYYKQDMERYLLEKEQKMTEEELKTSFVEWSKTNDKVPTNSQTTYCNGKEISIGRIWQRMKSNQFHQELLNYVIDNSDIFAKDYSAFHYVPPEGKEEKPNEEELLQILLEVGKKTTPIETTTYTFHHTKIKIGNIWLEMKRGKSTSLLEKLCSQSPVYKLEYEKYIKKKETKASKEEILQALLESAKNCLPRRAHKHKVNNKEIAIGKIWYDMKLGSHKDLLQDLLTANEHYKKDYEAFHSEN
jgi:hypothetical protein